MILQGVLPIKFSMYTIKFDFTWHGVLLDSFLTWTFE